MGLSHMKFDQPSEDLVICIIKMNSDLNFFFLSVDTSLIIWTLEL